MCYLAWQETIFKNRQPQFFRISVSSAKQFLHFQASVVQQLTMQSIRGRIVAYATDPQWSGVLNLKLQQGLSEGEIEMMILEVIPVLGNLMRNRFANHFVLSLFQAYNENQSTTIMGTLANFLSELINVCCSPQGGRAMQILLAKLFLPRILHVVSALEFGAVTLATNIDGRLVIEHCVRNFPPEHKNSLFRKIAINCSRIAADKNGCCVIQLCLQNSDGYAREQLVAMISVNVLQLAQHPFENYVVQHLIGMRIQQVIIDLISRLRGHFAYLARNKYANHVVQRLFQESGRNRSMEIIMELLESANASTLPIDRYGNFIIEAATSVARGPARDALLNFIRENADSLQTNPFGRRILEWYDRRNPNN